MELQAALDDFMLANQADGLSPATLKWYRMLFKPFAAAFHSRDISTIEAREIRAYIVGLQSKKERYTNAPQKPVQKGGYSPDTIHGHVRGLHTFWRWCSREYKITNPMENIKRPPLPERVPKAIAESDYVRLFNATGEDAAGKRDRAILAFFADTGCRLGGLMTLTREHLFLEFRRAIVSEKGRKIRTVYFTHYTEQLLKLWLDVRESPSPNVFVSMSTGEALTESGIHQLIKRLKKRAGVRGRTNPHSFRHNFARCYLLNGGDIAALSKMLGHLNITTTQAYYAVFSRDELADLHDKFTPMRKLRVLGK